MATVIKFDEGNSILVREDPDEVASALNTEGGLPVRLTIDKTGDEIYVNPKLITQWHPPLDRPRREMPRAAHGQGLGRRGP